MSNPFSIAVTRIRRSPYQAVAAVSIMTMTLFLAGAFFIIAAGSHAIIRFFESQPQVIGYFEPDFVPDPQKIERIKTQLLATGFISRFKYTSKEEALQIYTAANKTSPLLLEGVTANLLPASVEISTSDPGLLKTIAERLKEEPRISDIQFPEEIIAPFAKWTRSIRVVGVALVGTHILITYFIILLIMSVKVVGRRQEISTFQLLGATSGYISWPFIIEGFVYGLAGGFLAWGVAYLVLLYSMGFLVGFLSGIPILPPPMWFMFSVLGTELALGALIGGLGGFIAAHRFLKQ